MGHKQGDIASAMDQVGEMASKKQQIDMHAELATCLLDHVKARKLDFFHANEQEIISTPQGSGNKQKLKEMLGCDLVLQQQQETFLFNKDFKRDKIRAFMLYLLSQNDISKIDDMEKLLMSKHPPENENDLDYKSLQVLKKMRSMEKSQVEEMKSGISSTIYSYFSRVKNVVKKEGHLPITKTVKQAMENTKPLEDFQYLDSRHPDSEVRYNRTFAESFVFIIGGGNYQEYTDLLKWSESNSKTVIYGTTQLLSPTQFMHDLAKFQV